MLRKVVSQNLLDRSSYFAIAVRYCRSSLFSLNMLIINVLVKFRPISYEYKKIIEYVK